MWEVLTTLLTQKRANTMSSRKAIMISVSALSIVLIFASIASRHILKIEPENPYGKAKQACCWPIASRISESLDENGSRRPDNEYLFDRITDQDPRFSKEKPGFPDRDIVILYFFLPEGLDVGFPGPLISCTGKYERGGSTIQCGFILVDDDIYVVNLPSAWDEFLPSARSKCSGRPDLYFSSLTAPRFAHRAAKEATSEDLRRHVYRGPSPFSAAP
jgi:hypothetical protein